MSDPYGLYGTIQTIQPSWGVEGFDPSNPGGILAHHIAAGILGLLGRVFHLSVRPSMRLYSLLRMGSIIINRCSSMVCIYSSWNNVVW